LRVVGVVKAIFDTLVKEYNYIITPIKTEPKPGAFNRDIVNTAEIHM
jgi:hypothetical protein